MLFRKQAPSTALAPYVRYYWYFELGQEDLPARQPGFPYGSFELICYLQNPNLIKWAGSHSESREPELCYTGQVTQSYMMTFTEPCRCAGISLHPWAGNILYNTPAHVFQNALVPLQDIEADYGLYERMHACSGELQLFRVLEAYIHSRVWGQKPDPVVQYLAGRLIQSPLRDTCRETMNEIGLSRRRIEQRFLETAGLSPGLFTRKVRFQKAAYMLKQAKTEESLTSIGLLAGYYDQAHFIHDFKTFSGVSPKAFLNNAQSLGDFLTTLAPCASGQ